MIHYNPLRIHFNGKPTIYEKIGCRATADGLLLQVKEWTGTNDTRAPHNAQRWWTLLRGAPLVGYVLDGLARHGRANWAPRAWHPVLAKGTEPLKLAATGYLRLTNNSSDPRNGVLQKVLFSTVASFNEFGEEEAFLECQLVSGPLTVSKFFGGGRWAPRKEISAQRAPLETDPRELVAQITHSLRHL